MSFTSTVFYKDSDMLQEVFLQVSKYSSGEIIITDEKFNIVFHNTKFINDNRKRNLFDIMDSFSNENIRINIENFKNSNKNHIFLKLIFNDKGALHNIPVDVHICKVRNKKNKLKGYSVIINDVSQEIKNKIQKETFVDIITHDLKNPIRANIRILELILRNKFGYIENNLKTVLDELLNSCKFMNYMADNLLIKYKNEFDVYELQKEYCSIVKIIREKCDKLNNLLERKKQSIELVINGDIPDINLDKQEISKVVGSLIINASEQSIENSKIIIKIEHDNKNITVTFTDYGRVQKQEVLDGIFEEYITCSNKFRKIGFSLELFNCRRIIEAHNGYIYAKNEPEKGTSIIFTIPL